MGNCLFQNKTNYPSCEKLECLERHSAGCCAVCFCRSYCRDLCPWVADLRKQAEAKKKRRIRL